MVAVGVLVPDPSCLAHCLIVWIHASESLGCCDLLLLLVLTSNQQNSFVESADDWDLRGLARFIVC